MRVVCLAVLTMLIVGTASAQSQRTEHTLKLDDADARPPATFADVEWLVGSWSGPAFGGTAEEVWNLPSAGSMLGMFKLMQEGEVSFYELLVLVEEEGTLNLKVKHFNADFTAWETKEDYVNFRFISTDDAAIHFSGISFYRVTENEIHVYLALHDEERTWEQKLIYIRSGSSST
jgi:hypothetical protein